MRGLMQDVPLSLEMIFTRAETLFPDKTIHTVTKNGSVTTTYRDWCAETRRLGTALDQLGISADGRVATLAWNTARHMSVYFAAPCTGRVLHTLNLRLFPEQLVYVANHAEDEVVFVDRSVLPLLLAVLDKLTTLRHIVVMDDGGPAEIPDDPRFVGYEELLAKATEPHPFGVVDDENAAAAMCYTSGTTGEPKGVVYSHRSTLLHAMAMMLADATGISEADTIMPVVPMFHANAWGLAHAGVFAGSSFAMPGPDLTPEGLSRLMVEQKVTAAAGVPTIWMAVLPHLEGKDTSHLRAVLCGGSAVPKILSEGYRKATGKPILQAWGMTETSPVASVGRVSVARSGGSEDELAEVRSWQGLPAPLVQVRIQEPGTGAVLPWDGVAFGELQCRGPWIASAYYDDPRGAASFTDDGWLRTGDVAVIQRDGYIQLVDRTKDLVKSGGEWISSVELENEIMAHPKVAEAAVIGVPHPKWDERPLACVVLVPGETMEPQELIEYLRPKVAKFWLPDAVEFIDEVPKTSVGKFSKKTLRDQFADYRLEA